jgi:hypothetical protein
MKHQKMSSGSLSELVEPEAPYIIYQASTLVQRVYGEHETATRSYTFLQQVEGERAIKRREHIARISNF